MSDSQASRPSFPRRRWWFRLAAVLLGLLPLIVFELLCRSMGWGIPDLNSDPFVGFRSIQPLFVRNAEGDRWEIPESRTNWFNHDSFLVEKPPGQFRVFVLGGSTVQGRPFARQTSFTSWLEINLQLAAPSSDWRVVNCGGVSYASYRLVPILQETLEYQPDLYIIYTGHNEFLEDRSYGHLKDAQPLLEGAVAFSRQFRAVSTLKQWLSPPPETARPSTELPEEVEAWLDHEKGMDEYHRDLAWQHSVIQHYEYNLRRMIQLAQAANVPVILVNPVSNLRDCPPFKAEHRDDLTEDEKLLFESLVEQARTKFSTDMNAAIRDLEAARRIDDQYAGIHFLLGRCYERVGKKDLARAAFVTAKDQDICPLRMLESMHDIVLEVAHSTGTPLLDVRRLLAQKTDGQIQGSFMMVDHVHPSVDGHQAIANELLKLMATMKLVSPKPDWQAEQDVRFQKHIAALDEAYFLIGMARLEGLEKWARQRFQTQWPDDKAEKD